MLLLDQNADSLGEVLTKIAATRDVPAYVREASRDEVTGVPGMASEHFALRHRRLYPTHTKAATWVSAAYFAERGPGLPELDRAATKMALEAAAAYWGVRDEVRALFEAAEAETKRAAEAGLPGDDDWGLVRTLADGTVHRACPVRGVAEAKVAAEWLREHRAALTREERAQLAGRIVAKAAGELDGDTRDFLGRQLGEGGCGVKAAAALVRERAAVLSNLGWAGLGERLFKLAADVAARPGPLLDLPARDALIDAVDEVDRRSGLRKHADVPDPEEVLCGVTPKQAAEFARDHVLAPGGTIYALADLGAVPVRVVRDALGTAAAEKAADETGLFCDGRKLAALLEGLAPRQAAELEAELEASGVRSPVSVKLAAEGDRLGLDALEAALL